ncbi:hypothetical protein QE152_g3569 [Popillia japonica]|uniref:Uncharacterized protein n=1 Tax=Popillia japonica TaxID=7064 RepID=A0AAW1N1W4_POPJA
MLRGNKNKEFTFVVQLIDILEEYDVESGDIYITPTDGEETDADSDLSDDDHAGNICYLGPAILRAESEFVPSHHSFEIEAGTV